MKAKEYLSQIKKLNVIIQQKQEEYDRLRLSVIGKATSYDEKVQSSAVPDKIADTVAKYVDLEKELHCEIIRLEKVRLEIIEAIQNIEYYKYSEILYKRYVEMKPLGKIAREMGYSYQYIRELHGYALKKFKVPTKSYI